MTLADLRVVLGTGCLVKLGFEDRNGWDFSGRICDLDDRYDDYKVESMYNIDDQYEYDPYLRIVLE